MKPGAIKNQAIKMLAAGKSVKEIASALGIIYDNGAAHNRLKRCGINIRDVRDQHGITFDAWDDEIPAIKRMISEKVPAKSIAERYGMNYKQFYQILYRRGISIRRVQFYGDEA